MQLQLHALLSPEQLADLRQQLLDPQAPWRPGAETAGWHARTVKNNRQLDRSSPLHRRLAEQVQDLLASQPLLQRAALPLAIHSVRFSRCGPGEGYGLHLDNAFMAEGRADLSFTLFLSDPLAYRGGCLLLGGHHHDASESNPLARVLPAPEALRLAAGSAVVYPSTALHEVEPVRSGERLVAVGWIQSRVRSAERRELLFDLDTARSELFEREGKSGCFERISRSYTNLLRLWGE